jgi:hypothetical protein
MTGRRATAAVLALTAVGLGTTGCRERACRGGEHVVRSVEAPDTGRTCVPDGAPPPAGYEEYPPGEAPEWAP